MSQPIVLRAIMTGVNAGKTGVFGGYQFDKGVHLMVGQIGEFANRINVLRYYNAFLDGTDEYREAAKANGNSGIHEVSPVQSSGKTVGTEEGQVDSGVHSDESAASGVSNGTGHDDSTQGQTGVLPTGASEGGVTGSEPVDTRTQDAKYKKLRDLLMQLDPQNDAHWTQAGLPRLSVIEQALGDTGIVRADLEAAYPGFDREVASESF